MRRLFTCLFGSGQKRVMEVGLCICICRFMSKGGFRGWRYMCLASDIIYYFGVPTRSLASFRTFEAFAREKGTRFMYKK